MLKKCLLLILLSSFALQAQAEKEIAMLVVPRDAKTIRIAQDISQYYPIILVSYQQTSDLLKLYAWNGEGWVDVSEEDYVNGAFFENPPQHTILIDSKDAPAGEVLIPNGVWCKSGNRLTADDPRVIIHLLGRYFDFPNRRWKQLAKTYGYRVGDINPALINIYWFQYPPERPQRDLNADMDKWSSLDITPPPPVEPIVIEKEPEAVEPVEIPATELIEPMVEKNVEPVIEAKETVEEIIRELTPKKPAVDPFSTDDIPPAKIILPEAE